MAFNVSIVTRIA